VRRWTFILLVFFSCSKEKEISFLEINVGEIERSFVSDYHSSEGFLINSEGVIFHFFRLDSTSNSGHVGNSGKIVYRKSYDQGNNWSNTKTIYDSEYDDRNIHGGINNDGQVVLFFRRYDVPNYNQLLNGQTIDHRYLIFDPISEVILFSEKMESPSSEDHQSGCMGTNKVFSVPGKGYFASFYSSNSIDFQFSIDGRYWNNTWQNAYNFNDNLLTEPCFLFIGNNTIIGLARDGISSTTDTSNYYQLVSFDNGFSWKEPIRTNIDVPHYTPAPLIFLEPNTERIISISTTRETGINDYISVYSNEKDTVSSNPKGYQLVRRLDRPVPTDFRLYGYPTYTKIDDFNYLIVFTESYIRWNGSEGAHFYQFKISIN